MFDLEQFGLDEDELNKQRVPAVARPQQQQNSEPSPSAPAQVLSSALSSPPIRKAAPVANPDTAQAPQSAPAFARPAARLTTPGPQPVAPKMPVDTGVDTQRIMRDAGLGPENVIPPPASGFGKPGQSVPELIQKRATAAQPLIPQGAPVPKQYRMGLGSRILGTAANFARGFGGYRGDPIYVGRGATNNQYERDTETQTSTLGNLDKQITEQRGEDDESRKLYADAVKAAYEGRIGEARQTAADATENWRKAQAENADTRRQAEADKAAAASRDITFDAKSGRFLQNGKVYVPKNIEEGASLEAANGINGKYSKLWGGERKNQPIQINTHERKLSARDEGRVSAYERQTGKDREDFTTEEWDAALGKGGAGKPKDFTKDREQAEKDKEAELDKLERQFSVDFAKNSDDKATQDALTKAHEQNKARVQKAYEEKLRIIGEGESKQPSRAANQPPAQPRAQAPSQPAPQATQFPLKEFGGHKAGETVKLKSGKSVKITGFNSKGQFSYDEQQSQAEMQ